MNLQEKRVLNSLGPIIKKWKIIIKEYSNKNKNEDALYWYNERATLSTFAGAIWLSDGTALEEFSSKKIKSQNKKSVRTKSGRTDLRFEWQDKQYIVEAKQISPSLHNSKPSIIVKLQKSLDIACNDVAKFFSQSSRKKYVRIGVTFLTPYLPKSYEGKCVKIKSIIRKLKKDLKQKLRYQLLAFISSDATVRLQDKDGKDGNLIYPLVVLAAKVARI